MKKIGIVIGQLNYGGTEKQAVLLAKGLLRTGKYKPVVFCLSPNIEPYGRFLTESSVEWHVISGRIISPFRKVLWLIKQARLAGISLLYGFLNVGNIYVAIVGLANRLPFICSIRNADSSLPVWLKIPSRWSCNQADFIIANSTSCARSLRDDLGVKHSRFGIINNALEFSLGNYQTRENLRAEWGLPNDAIVIGTIANLKKQKNPLFFIDVFKNLKRLLKNRSLFFIWIGDGPQRNIVDSAILSLDTDERGKVLFPGARSDISNVLKVFDIFILTSSYEGLPNSLMEAMAVGLPCIATNVAGTKDILSITEDGEEIGILASSASPQEFANTVFELLVDPSRMKRMGNAAEKFVQNHYSLGKMVLAHCDIFDNVLAFKQMGGGYVKK